MIETRSIRGRLRGVAGIVALGAVAACAAEDTNLDGTPSMSLDAPLVGTHSYRAPAKPTKSYAVPSSNVIWVAPAGSDTSGTGDAGAPYKTIAKAVAIANAKAAGPTWTIVLKAGTYREGQIVITRSNVTIQRNVTDAVSIYGTTPASGFAGSGPYTVTVNGFDTAPLEANCADDHLNTGASKHYGSEQAFGVVRGGVPLKRVATGTAPSQGQYAYDNASNKLTLADSPTNVEVVQKLWAFQTRASGVRFLGLDIEGYGTCTVDYQKVVNGVAYYAGAVQIFKDSPQTSGAVVDGCTIANNSSGALQIAQSGGVTVSNDQLVNNGLNGIHGGKSDGLVISDNVIGYNNFRQWANSTEAGVKITFIHDGAVVGNVFEHNAANGFWCDQGCGPTDLSKNYFVIARNVFRNNDGKGLFYEVSHHAMIASNVMHDNGGPGIAAYGSRAVQIWNNTLVDNNSNTLGYTANLSLVDDTRCALGDTLPGGKPCTSATPGVVPLDRSQYDHCAPSSDGPLANTCNTESTVVVNNIISGSGGSRPLVNVSVPAKTYPGSTEVTRSEFQAFWRPGTTQPSTLIEWQKDAAGGPIAYGSLSAFQAAIGGREVSSVEKSGGTNPYFVDYANKNFVQSTSSTDVWGRGQTLPPEALKAVYWPATAPAQPAKRVGAIDWTGRVATPPPPPPPSCAFATPVYRLRNPSTGGELLTLSPSEVASAKASGYTEDHGIAFAAAATGTTPVYQLFRPASHDRLYTTSASERTSAISAGYTTDEGIAFYVSAASATCVSPIHRVQKGGIHAYTESTTELAALVAAGWNDEGTHFYAGAP